MARKDGESVLRKVVTLSDVAALTVQSERSIQRLVKSGVIRLAKDRQRRQLKGRFVLGDCIPRICEHLRDQMTAADPNAAAYAEARARRMQCVAEVAELELKQKKRELHHARDVEFVLSLMIRNARDRLRAMPSRTMFMVQGKAPPEINRLIAGEIDTALNELADETDLSAKFRRETDAYLATITQEIESSNGEAPED